MFMDGEINGAKATGSQDGLGAQEPQGHEASGAEAQGQPVAGDDYEAQLAAKDAKIAELSAQVAEAAKSAETASKLGEEIASLKQTIADERVEFALKSAGARNVKAALALMDDYEGTTAERVAAMAEACPWLFEGRKASSGATSQVTSQNLGATGLPSEGVAGGGDGRDLRRWERIAGLDEKEA